MKILVLGFPAKGTHQTISVGICTRIKTIRRKVASIKQFIKDNTLSKWESRQAQRGPRPQGSFPLVFAGSCVMDREVSNGDCFQSFGITEREEEFLTLQRLYQNCQGNLSSWRGVGAITTMGMYYDGSRGYPGVEMD